MLPVHPASWVDGEADATILDVGIGRIFCLITDMPHCCRPQYVDTQGDLYRRDEAAVQDRPVEVRFAKVCRFLFVAGVCLSLGALILYIVPHDRSADMTSQLLSDAFGPLVIQVVIAAWFFTIRVRLRNLDKGARAVAATTAASSDPAARQAPGTWRGSLTTAGSIRGSSRSPAEPPPGVQTHDLFERPTAPAVDLEKLKFQRGYAPVDPHTGCQINSAAELLKLIAYRGAQPGLYTHAFRGAPRLPEGSNFTKSLVVGTLLGVGQAVF
eukprot:Hpha_TRINITY_DN9474_c1_g1::TRINITY_DN9474_c1_g1_i1::g.139144::m.139144